MRSERSEIAAEWRDFAYCRDIQPEVFFPDEDDGEGIARAQRLCAACAVAVPCGEYALRNQEPDGVWGGMSAKDRRRVLRMRRKGLAT
jgi:WhiB family transcriptional regulator, redox-sensing transcriptional regulator